MATAYRIYTNHGDGGPVDYSAPVASTAGLSFTAGPLGLSTDNTFVVRAYDPDSGFEQAGSEARVRLVVGADGGDASGLPNEPHSVSLSSASGGGARLSWAYAPAEPWGTPAGFEVFLTPGRAVDDSSPAARVPYAPGGVGYSCVLRGPYPLSTYSAAVRAYNAVGAGANTPSVAAVLGLPAPFAMDPLRVTIGPPGR